MIQSVIVLLILSIVVEAISEIITSSEIIRPLRDLVKRHTYSIDAPPPDTFYQLAKVWFDKLISCGYCVSIWVAGFLALWVHIDYTGGNGFINWLITTFVTHRLANSYHVVYELVRKGRVATYDIELKLGESYGDDGEGSPEGSSEIEPRIFKASRDL